MDFNDTPEEAAFRAEALAWLAANAQPRDAAHSLAINQETGDFSAEFAHAKAWQARKFDAGFGAIYFPADVGGRGGSVLEHMIFAQEEAAFDVPATNHFMIVNRGCCALLMKHGSQTLHRELIRPSLIAAQVRLARQVRIGGRPAIEDGGVRERLASFHVREAGVRCTVQRMLTALARREEPGPEIAIGKLVLGTLVQEMTAFALDLMGAQGAVTDAAHSPMAGVWQSEWMGSVVDRLGGGSDEIMRNVIGERILGLPEDARVDKTLPFNELATGAR